MTRDFGPYRLGPVDMLIAVNALRFLIVPPGSRMIWIGVALFLPTLALSNAYQSDWIGVTILTLVSVLFLVLGPLLSGRNRHSVVLRITRNGLLAISDETENLYKSIDVGRMRTVFGRLLIPVNKQCVVIVPARAIGEASVAELEAAIRAFAAGHHPPA